MSRLGDQSNFIKIEAQVPRLHECSLKPAAQDANYVKNGYAAMSEIDDQSKVY